MAMAHRSLKQAISATSQSLTLNHLSLSIHQLILRHSPCLRPTHPLLPHSARESLEDSQLRSAERSVDQDPLLPKLPSDPLHRSHCLRLRRQHPPPRRPVRKMEIARTISGKPLMLSDQESTLVVDLRDLVQRDDDKISDAYSIWRASRGATLGITLG